MQKKIIAIFGGSFNPPVNSHVALAKEILDKYKKIDKLIFVPVSTKYQKQELIENEHRYNMLKIICQKEEKMEVSNIEMIMDKQLYTIQTLEYFNKKYKENDIHFVMGTDNLKELENWREAEKLLKNYKVIVLERENDNFDKIINENRFLSDNRQSLIKIEGIDKILLSSTMIRNKIKNGEDVEEFIDKDVLKYIKENNLYERM